MPLNLTGTLDKETSPWIMHVTHALQLFVKMSSFFFSAIWIYNGYAVKVHIGACLVALVVKNFELSSFCWIMNFWLIRRNLGWLGLLIGRNGKDGWCQLQFRASKGGSNGLHCRFLFLSFFLNAIVFFNIVHGVWLMPYEWLKKSLGNSKNF